MNYSICNLALSKYTFGIFSQMATRQTQHKPARNSNQSESADDLEGNQQDDVTHSPDPQQGSAGVEQPVQLDKALNSQLDELIQCKVQQLDLGRKTGLKQDTTHALSETESNEVSVHSQHTTTRCVPQKQGSKHQKRKLNVSTSSDSALSEGDKCRRTKTKRKKKYKHKKVKKSKRSSTSSSSESSFPSSDSDNKEVGVMEQKLAKVSKKKRPELAESVTHCFRC